MSRPKLYKTEEERYWAFRNNIKRYLEKNPKKRLLTIAKANAKRKGLEFSITEEDLIIPEYCPLLGIKLTSILGKGRIQTNMSIDRKDSNKGYIKNNVWILSDLANRMKQDATPEQLKQFAQGIITTYAKDASDSGPERVAS